MKKSQSRKNRTVRRRKAGGSQQRTDKRNSIWVQEGTQRASSPEIEMAEIQRLVGEDKVTIINRESPAGGYVSCTVGMIQLLGKPELAMTGLSPATAGTFLLSVACGLQETDFCGNDLIIPLGTSKYHVNVKGTRNCAEQLDFLHEYYGREDIEVVQCYYSDANAVFPWDAASNAEFREAQFELPWKPMS